MAEKFFFYSFTNRRCIIDNHDNGEFAWTLEPESKEYPDRNDIYDLSNQYIVTTLYGSKQRHKVESRIFRNKFDVINWADFVQSQNPKKEVSIWKIVDS